MYLFVALSFSIYSIVRRYLKHLATKSGHIFMLVEFSRHLFHWPGGGGGAFLVSFGWLTFTNGNGLFDWSLPLKHFSNYFSNGWSIFNNPFGQIVKHLQKLNQFVQQKTVDLGKHDLTIINSAGNGWKGVPLTANLVALRIGELVPGEHDLNLLPLTSL